MIEGFSYSSSKCGAICNIDEATDEYIKDPKAKIPGTKMTPRLMKIRKQMTISPAYLKQSDSGGTAQDYPAGRKLAKVQ